VTLIRSTTLLAGLTGKPESRSELSTGIQLVGRGRVAWAKKSFWFRNAPYTVGPWAHDGQIQVRLTFADAAHRAKGRKGLAPDGLPWAAHEVKTALTGYRASRAMSPEEYPSKIRRTAYTAEELESIARKRGIL